MGAVWRTDTASGTVDRIDETAHRVRSTPVRREPRLVALVGGSVWVFSPERRRQRRLPDRPHHQQGCGHRVGWSPRSLHWRQRPLGTRQQRRRRLPSRRLGHATSLSGSNSWPTTGTDDATARTRWRMTTIRASPLRDMCVAHSPELAIRGWVLRHPADEPGTTPSQACDLRLYLAGSPAWTRTRNLPVNSRALCQLSYRGTNPALGPQRRSR
jgi:hypothetical protein